EIPIGELEVRLELLRPGFRVVGLVLGVGDESAIAFSAQGITSAHVVDTFASLVRLLRHLGAGEIPEQIRAGLELLGSKHAGTSHDRSGVGVVEGAGSATSVAAAFVGGPHAVLAESTEVVVFDRLRRGSYRRPARSSCRGSGCRSAQIFAVFFPK